MHKRILSTILVFALLLPLLCGVSAFGTPQEQEQPIFDGYIVKLKGGTMSLMDVGEDEKLESLEWLDDVYVVKELADVQRYINAGMVEYFEPDYILKTLDTAPNDTYYSSQWTLETIGYPSLYSGGYNGSGVTVAIIDTGVYAWYEGDTYYGHEDFNGVKISPHSRNLLGNGSAADSEKYYYRDQKGHGTFVASQIAAVTNNGRGISATASGVELMILRCMADSYSEEFAANPAYDANSGKVSVIANAIAYAAEKGADVINLSLGEGASRLSADTINTLQLAVTAANNEGVIVVAAVGNDGNKPNGTEMFFPAACSNVIGVGSVVKSDDSLSLSGFSQRNASVDITAPGEKVVGIHIYPDWKNYINNSLYANETDSYITGGGTSYSAPVVSALAAIVKQVNSALDHDDVLSLLAATSTDYGAAGWDASFGYGVVNASALLTALTETEHKISYVLNDNISFPALIEGDYAETFKLNRSTEVPLPIPTRPGHAFAGWYERIDLSDTAKTTLPAGALGTMSYNETDSSYSITDYKLYAAWIESESIAVESVRVLGHDAVTDSENSSVYDVRLPADAIGSLASLRANDIAIACASEGAVSTVPVTTDGGETWTFSIAYSSLTKEYTIKVSVSALKMPTVVNGQVAQSGSAVLQSLDGGVETSAYKADIEGWFADETEYEIVSCDGAGTAAVSEDGGVTHLFYTPETADNGKNILITLRAKNAEFTSADTVTVTIAVSRARSDSELSSLTESFDKHIGGTVTVDVTMYGNSLTGLKYNNANMAEGEDYTVDGMDDCVVRLMNSFLSGLSVGENEVSFVFSGSRTAGKDVVTLTLNVTDSTPRYTVKFYRNAGDTAVYQEVKDIIEGSKLGTLPTKPIKDGHTFKGWYLQNGTTQITENSIIDSSINVYASWTKTDGGGSGGGFPAGPSGSGNGGNGDKEKTAYTEYGETDVIKQLALDAVVLTENAGDAGVLLTKQGVEKLAASGKSLTAKNAVGTITLSSKDINTLKPSDGEMLVLSLIQGVATGAQRTQAGVGTAETVLTFEAAVSVISEEADGRSLTEFSGGVKLEFELGAKYAGSAVNIAHLYRNANGTAAIETYTVKADSNGRVSLTVYRLSAFLVYAAPTMTFDDVENGKWFYDYVDYAWSTGLMNGVSERSFMPNAPMSRAMLVTVLYRLAGEPNYGKKSEYTDIEDGKWYSDAVHWASGLDIVSGYGDWLFGTEDDVTREQIMVIFYRYFKTVTTEEREFDDLSQRFDDADAISNWAVPSAEWAVDAGLITGVDERHLVPGAVATRAEVAAMLMRLTAILEK